MTVPAIPQRPGVVIYRPVDPNGASHRRIEAAGCRIMTVAETDDLDRSLAAAAPVHAILAASLRGVRLDRPRLAALEHLRIVAKYSIGVDDVDVDAATELGILVTHCPTEANYGGVAEGAVALMLALLKRVIPRDRAVRSGGWRSDALTGIYLGARSDGYAGITLGIVGLGRVGRRLAQLLAPWQLTMIATDPYVDDGVFSAAGVQRVGLDELLERADVVSLHCPLTAETAGLIGAARIARMKRGAILINTARGRIVDADAVCAAIDAGRLGGAAFDVLPDEPPEPGARVLTADDRVVLSPHMVAANQGGTLGAAIPWTTEAALHALAGFVPEHVYNPQVIARWNQRFGGRSLLAERARA